MSRNAPSQNRAVTLTLRGLVATICAQAAPYDWTVKAGDAQDVCAVTVYVPRCVPQDRGEQQYAKRACGEAVAQGGLCARHAADRERLLGGAW